VQFLLGICNYPKVHFINLLSMYIRILNVLAAGGEATVDVDGMGSRACWHARLEFRPVIKGMSSSDDVTMPVSSKA
jgi:hypothetical protein